MSSSGGGSVSTAQAGGRAVKSNKSPNNNMPPRRPIANNNNMAATKGDTSVPHVVRVTFLGVAGLLAKSPHPDNLIGQDIQQTPSGDTTNSSLKQSNTKVIKTSPAVNHPSLLFPLPSNLKIVASVSRSRTARGIPSGLSKCLSNSNSNNRPSPLSPSSMTPGAGSFALSPVAGESIIVEKNQLPNLDTNNKPIKEVDISKDSSEAMIDTISSAKKELRGNNNNNNNDHLSPPSQLSHKRTNSSRHSNTSGKISINSGWGSKFSSTGGENVSISTEKQQNTTRSQQDNDIEQNEGIDNIEVIRPLSPTDGLERDEPPERFVAVWGSDSERFTKKTSQKLNNKQYVNLTNSLAFEAELRPSDIPPIAENNRTASSKANKASTSFAPKSFCVAVGLVPDFNPTALSEERIDEESATSTPVNGGEDSEKKTVSSNSTELPTFAIPVGFADLVINGNETLDGKRKQIDLPLSSLTNFIGLEKNNNSFPLIELTAGGLSTPANNNNNTEADSKDTPGKRKKKSIVKRMFSRKQQSTSGDDTSSQGQNVYDGTPQSIYHLPNRPPNAKERNLFLDRFGVDPSGDAVIRIALEVFPRGSELEKVFRQKNKLRKKQAAAAAAASDKSRSTRGRRPNDGRISSSTSISSQTADSFSLMDDDDEQFDSDDDSIFSQSFFSLDSYNSRSTWDNSTMYTDGLSSFHTMDDDESFITGFDTAFDPPTEEDDKRKSPESTLPKVKSASNFLSNLFNCGGSVTNEVAAISVKEEKTLATTAQHNVVDTSSIASMDTERQKTTHQIKQQLGDDKQGLGNYNDDLDNLVDAVDERQRQQEGTEFTLEEFTK